MRNQWIAGGIAALSLLSVPAPAQAPGSAASNRQIALDAFDAIQRQDYARLRQFTRTDAVFQIEGAPEPVKLDSFIGLLKDYWKAFPDTTHILHQVLVDGNQLAVRVTYQSTHRAAYEGVPATGHWIAYSGVHFLRFDQGQICEWWVMNDHLARMRQLGSRLVPAKTPDPPRLGE